MAIYRQVYITFWQDPFILELTPEEKFFYLYLMTNSKTKQCGCYEIPKKVMCFETGYNLETIDKLISRFEEYGKIKYDSQTKEVILINWLKYNPVNNINIAKCVNREIGEIKSEELKGLVRGLYAPTKKQEEEQEEEQEQEQEEGRPPPDTTEAERETLGTLRAVPKYPIDYPQDLDMIRSLAIDYPTVDILEETKKWRDYKRDKPLKNKSSPRLQLRNWMKNAKKWSDERKKDEPPKKVAIK